MFAKIIFKQVWSDYSCNLDNFRQFYTLDFSWSETNQTECTRLTFNTREKTYTMLTPFSLIKEKFIYKMNIKQLAISLRTSSLSLISCTLFQSKLFQCTLFQCTLFQCNLHSTNSSLYIKTKDCNMIHINHRQDSLIHS